MNDPKDAALDQIISAGMLADRLRPLVLGGATACIDNTPMIPLHRATVTAIYQHMERLALMDGEVTIGQKAARDWSTNRDRP